MRVVGTFTSDVLVHVFFSVFPSLVMVSVTGHKVVIVTVTSFGGCSSAARARVEAKANKAIENFILSSDGRVDDWEGGKSE